MACQICYRHCEMRPGDIGWCGARTNRDGHNEPVDYGVVSCCVRQMRGYGPDPFLTYKPGATALFLGGLRCTAGCTFCMSTTMVHKPQAVPWGLDPPGHATADSLWYGARAHMAPSVAVDAAEHWGCSQVSFGINEATMSPEWTLAVAYEAKGRGLNVCLETNGFTSPKLIEVFAPYVDAVDVGVKGSASSDFYDRHMRSPGAVPHVLEALRVWQAAGVHLIVGDLVAPPHMQSDVEFVDAAQRFYGRIAETLGQSVPVLTTPMFHPGPAQAGGTGRQLVRQGEEQIYTDRLATALQFAQGAGLYYAHTKLSGTQMLPCHACRRPLLVFSEACGAGWRRAGAAAEPYDPCVMAENFCPWWSHQQFVTDDSRCEWCGAAVPVAVLSAPELAAARSVIASATRHLTATVEQSYDLSVSRLVRAIVAEGPGRLGPPGSP